MNSSMPLTGRLLDYEYAIDVSSDELRQHLHAVLFDSLADVRSPERIQIRNVGGDRYDVAAGEAITHRAVASQVVVDKLVWALNRRSAERRPGTRGQHDVMIHAGAVEYEGAGVLVVGPSGSGKTTASIGAALHGFCLLTDDIAAVDRSGAVRGSRKPVGLRRGAMEVLGIPAPRASNRFSSRSSIPVAASSLGVRFGDTAQVGVVLFPDQHGAPGELRPISRAVALQRLTANCFEPVPLAHPDFETLAMLVGRAVAFEWTHGPLSDFTSTLREILGEP